MNTKLANQMDTHLLRAIAILLVINSHMDRFYPIPALATGGALGNALFFALSAYGLTQSDRQQRRSLVDWVSRRFWRIYPAVWVALTVYWIPLHLLNGSLSHYSVLDVIGYAFYPPFWFLQVLLPAYPLAFFLARRRTPYATLGCLLAGMLLYGYVYVGHLDLSVWCVESLPFKILPCFLLFIFGVLLAQMRPMAYRGAFDWVALTGILIAIHAHKYAMSRGLLCGLQVLQQALLLPFVYYALKVSRCPWLHGWLMRHPAVCLGVGLLSAETLGIYMVHTTIHDDIAHLGLPFPGNVLLFLTSTVVLVVLTSWLTRLLTRWIESR